MLSSQSSLLGTTSSNATMPRKLLVGGMQRTGTLKGASMKKVPPPVVPDITHRHSGSSFSSGYGSQTATDRSSCGSLGNEDFTVGPSGTPTSPRRETGEYQNSHCRIPGALPSPTRPIAPFCFPDAHTHYTQVVVHARPSSQPSTPEESTPPLGFPSTLSGSYPAHLLGTQGSLEDQGIDVGRESPSGSSGSSCTSGVSSSSSTSSGGSRHSTSSLDSGRASASSGSSDGGKGAPSQHRLSVQSCESVGSSSQRPSCHSSNSSLGSLDRLEESTSTPSSTSSSAASTSARVHVAEMLLHGIHDEEILRAWLSSLHFEEYTHFFIQAGYDMPTISRMTPEDLTAIGITKPAHRRKLKAEIARLNISDGIPDYKPDSLLEWLRLLRLEDYYDTLCHQGYDTVDRVTELTWEDLEEIGIQKLGHQKKIMLAIKRVKDINNGVVARRAQQHYIPEAHVQPLDIPIGSGATLPRPAAISRMHPSNSPYPYGQEVVITTSRTKAYSPTSETSNVPEFKTFQQSPPKGDGFRYMGFGELHSPTHTASTFFPDNVIIQVRSPNRGRSLESLGMDDSVSTHAHYPFHGGTDCWYDTVSASRQHGYDTDSELSVHSGDSYVLYEPDGTATLHRPRGMVKPRPVAKIVAKTRRTEQQPMDFPGEGEPKSQTKALQEHIDGWASLDGSPRHGTLPNRSSNTPPPPATNQNYGTLKGKRNPPPPPKRTNSIKSEHHSPAPPVPVDRSLEAMQDQAFATCVKSLASRFNMATSTSKEEDLPPPPASANPLPPAGSEDFPPPPCLDSLKGDTSVEVAERQTCGYPGNDGSAVQSSNSAKELVQLNELQNNPLFRARRKDSADSNISSSSTDSNSLPFANENVGTIKQRTAKPHPSMVAEAQSPAPSPSSTLRRTSLPSVLGSSRRSEGHPMERAGSDVVSHGNILKSSATSGDVIDDIENMLANLSNQLDAMLESEINGQ